MERKTVLRGIALIATWSPLAVFLSAGSCADYAIQQEKYRQQVAEEEKLRWNPQRLQEDFNRLQQESRLNIYDLLPPESEFPDYRSGRNAVQGPEPRPVDLDP